MKKTMILFVSLFSFNSYAQSLFTAEYKISLQNQMTYVGAGEAIVENSAGEKLKASIFKGDASNSTVTISAVTQSCLKKDPSSCERAEYKPGPQTTQGSGRMQIALTKSEAILTNLETTETSHLPLLRDSGSLRLNVNAMGKALSKSLRDQILRKSGLNPEDGEVNVNTELSSMVCNETTSGYSCKFNLDLAFTYSKEQ